MRLYLILFMAALFASLSLAPEVAYAQNPKQSKKRAKASKKAKKAKKEPYTPVYHDRDSDGDGVADSRDQCIHTPKGEPVTPFGCPYDVDFDGVYDYEDSCKNEAGPRDNKGCPYTDRDGDGIMDNKDLCPDVPGLKIFAGCPDSDGDGIADNDDRCPQQPGVKEHQGCPPPFMDADKDGVSDFEDLCPNTPGTKRQRGCPELKPEVQQAIDMAVKNLNFETNSDVILNESYASLNKLAEVMLNNRNFKLYLEGHTDNVGNDELNLDLSKRRAASVKRYLVQRGVSDLRITTAGFGEARPIGDNNTDEGRRQNRRVEFHIIQ
jgi:OOP family OmpA-OmpF porin